MIEKVFEKDFDRKGSQTNNNKPKTLSASALMLAAASLGSSGTDAN